MTGDLLLFVVPFAIAAALPGPAQGALVAHVLACGGRASLPFAIGMVAGNSLWLAAAMFGLSAIAVRFELLFLAVKWLGVAYLLFTAWKLWHAPPTVGATRRLDASGMGSGIVLALGNPKAVVFFGSVLPHAFDMKSLSPMDMGSILILGLCIDLGVQLVYLLAAARARGLFQSERRMKVMNRSSAGLMAGSAALIASRF